ncbi:MAG: MATE family efflux transporter [Oscillospiraceae bacterium]|nr:MATE family efflux transporter [Oscillospiraceae bacterium]
MERNNQLKKKKDVIRLSDHFNLSRLMRFCLPSIIMMVFTSIYGVVDGYFVSNFVGKTAFAAVNLIMPFLMILGGVGFMVGTGGSALVAKCLGEKDDDKARRVFSMMIYLTLILGVTLSVLGIIFAEPMARFLGADESMLGNCVTYARTCLIFNTMFMLQNVFQSFLVTAEKPKLGLAVIVAAGCTNMVLDALFIAVFRWEVIGAALATGLSQTVGGLLPLLFFLRKDNGSKLRIVKTGMEIRPIVQACANGASELMTNISSSIVSMLYNHQLIKLAGENGVSAYGVLMYVSFIFAAIYIGYAIGTAPIVGYNFGAQNHPEMKNILKKSVRLMLGTGVVMLGLAQLLAAPLAHVFVGYDQELFNMTVHAFRLFSFMFLFSGFNIFTSSFFTALNNGAISAAVSFLRTLVFQMAAVLILPVFFKLDGVWISVAFAEICAFVISIIFLVAKRKKYQY